MIQGHYSTIVGYVYIQVKGSKVTTHIKGKLIELIKKSDGRIYPRYKLLKLFPIRLGNASFSIKPNKNKIQIAMYEPDKKNKTSTSKIVAQKFKPREIPALWKQRTGNYKATLIKGKSKIKKIKLAIKRGVLVAYINQLKNPYPLLALSPSQLFSPSAGHNRDQTIHIASLEQGLNLEYANNRLLLKRDL